MIRRPPSSTRTYTLFPYTTLFRSRRGGIGVEGPLMLHLLAAARARRLEIEQVEDLAFSHEGATRQAARQDFRQGREIRRDAIRSEEHTSELQSLMRISYAVFCLQKKNDIQQNDNNTTITKHT